jgi:hypothetical protein
VAENYLKSVRNETSVKSGCFFFLLPSSFLTSKYFFLSLEKEGKRKKEEGKMLN